jgi:hypothetical protein
MKLNISSRGVRSIGSRDTREVIRHRQTVMTGLEIRMGVGHVCDRSKGGVRQSNHTDASETASAVGFLECAVTGSGVLPSRRMKVTPRSLHLQHVPMHAHHRILDGKYSTDSFRACGVASILDKHTQPDRSRGYVRSSKHKIRCKR